jgi:hypothetical protein
MNSHNAIVNKQLANNRDIHKKQVCLQKQQLFHSKLATTVSTTTVVKVVIANMAVNQ